MASDIVKAVADILADRRGGAASGVNFAQLMEAARRGAETEVTRLCERLPERERFVAVLAGGLAHPEVFRAAAVAANEDLPRGEALAWTKFCHRDLAKAWALAMVSRLESDVIAGLLGRDVYGAGALRAAVEDRTRRNELGPARVLYEAMSGYVKDDKAAARAAIALAEQTRALGDQAVTAQLEAAIDDAAKPPIIETGGEEVAALAELLAVIVASGFIPPEHAAVARLVERLHALRKSHPKDKDQKSWGYLRAATTAADAATREQPGWLAVADAIRGDIWRDEERLAPKLSAARARIAGETVAVEPAAASDPVARTTLSELALEERFEVRCHKATALAASAWTEGNLQGFGEAVAIAIAPPSLGLGAAERVTLSAFYLARAVQRGDLASERDWEQLPARWAAPEALAKADLVAIAAEAERALGAAERQRLAGTFIDQMIPTPLVFLYREHVSGGLAEATFVSALLARLLSPLDDPQREAALLRAASFVRQHEDRPGAHVAESRRVRVEQALVALGAARSPEQLEQRLPSWLEALAPTPELSAVLARYLPAWDTARIESRLGPPTRPAVELCGAWTRAGRFKDALALAKKCSDDVHARTLCEMAWAPLDAKQTSRLLAAFEKCPKGGRDKDHQAQWRHRRARLRLRLGRFDEAIELMTSIGDGDYVGTGAGPFALEIVDALDRSQAWTGKAAEALVIALAETGVVDPDIRWAVIASAWPHAPAPASALARLRKTAFEGDVGAVDLGVGTGLVRAGDVAASEACFRDGIERLLSGRRRHVEPALAFEALRELARADGGRAAPLLERSYALFQDSHRDTAQRARRVMQGLTEHEIDRVLYGLDTLPAAFAEPARDALAQVLATRFARHANAREVLVELINQAPDLATTERRAAWLAVALTSFDPRPARELAEASRILA